jgi:hypothetical protein
MEIAIGADTPLNQVPHLRRMRQMRNLGYYIIRSFVIYNSLLVLFG